MENTQFSFLNALFGGKASGSVSALGDVGANEAQKEQDQKGFFSFLEGLLTTSPDGSEENLNAAVAPQTPLPFQSSGKHAPLANADDRVELPNDAAGAAPFVAAELGNSVTANTVSQIDDLAPPLGASAHLENVKPDLPQPVAVSTVEGATIAGPQIAAVSRPEISKTAGTQLGALARPEAPTLASPHIDTASRVGDVSVHGLQNADIRPAALASTPMVAQLHRSQIAESGNAAQGQKPITGNTHAQAVVPTQSNGVTAPFDSELTIAPEQNVEGVVRSDEGESRFVLGAGGPHGKTPGLLGNINAKASQAIADHASPEAVTHSAVTREEGGDGIEFDRLASSRLENTANVVGQRNVHINPIRDQVIAAVVARQGDAKLEIRLDPPELGRVMIGFERDGADIVRAVVTADSPETLDLMRRNADMFQRSLEEQGFAGLDLQFSDAGAGENTDEGADENSHAFALVEDEAMTAAVSAAAPQLAEGRLDRRL